MSEQRSRVDVMFRVGQFCEALEDFCNKVAPKSLPYTYVISTEVGKKYIRVVRKEQVADREPMNGSVHCFIDLATGDILKAASWNKPAPQVRGSIFKDDFDIGPGKAVGQFGAAYLR